MTPIVLPASHSSPDPQRQRLLLASPATIIQHYGYGQRTLVSLAADAPARVIEVDARSEHDPQPDVSLYAIWPEWLSVPEYAAGSTFDGLAMTATGRYEVHDLTHFLGEDVSAEPWQVRRELLHQLLRQLWLDDLLPRSWCSALECTTRTPGWRALTAGDRWLLRELDADYRKPGLFYAP